jgi:predicted RNase H-like HicB family nuclease
MSREHQTRILAVVVAPKEGAWHAWCPVLLDYGAATWAATREEALEHIRMVVAMTVERMAKEGVPIPADSAAPAPPPAERVVLTVRVPAA